MNPAQFLLRLGGAALVPGAPALREAEDVLTERAAQLDLRGRPAEAHRLRAAATFLGRLADAKLRGVL